MENCIEEDRQGNIKIYNVGNKMKTGDIVRHIAGSPKMAIVCDTHPSMYATSWYDEQYGSFQQGWFMKELLELAE